MLCWRLTFSGTWEACGAAQGVSKETDSQPLLVIILAGEGRNLLWAVAQVLLPVLPLFLMKPQHRSGEWLVGCDPSTVNRSLESNSCVEVVVPKVLSFLINLKSFSFLWQRKLKYSSFFTCWSLEAACMKFSYLQFKGDRGGFCPVGFSFSLDCDETPH